MTGRLLKGAPAGGWTVERNLWIEQTLGRLDWSSLHVPSLEDGALWGDYLFSIRRLRLLRPSKKHKSLSGKSSL